MPDKPWLAAYPQGVPAEIDPGQYHSLKVLLESSFERYASSPALSNRGTTLAFRETERLSRQFAAYLQSIPGISPGDRVAVMLPNLLQYPVTIFGILRAGLVVVNVNPFYTSRELEHQLVDSGATAIVVLENFAATVEDVLDRTDIATVIVTSVGDHFPAFKRVLINAAVKWVKRMVPKWRIAGAVSYREALAEGRWDAYEDVEVGPDDPAFIQYTGGTTGISKGAVLTHRNVVSNVLQATAWAKPFLRGEGEIVLTPLPLYHVFSLTANLLSFVELGGHDVLVTDPRDMRGLVAQLQKTPCTFITGVNTLFKALLNAPGIERVDFSALRVSLGGGMAVQQVVAEGWRALTGRPLAQGYGLTEASPIVCANPLDERDFNGSVGLPLPSTDVAIMDDDGAMLGLGREGEIAVRGPQVMKGYWNKPEETAAVLDADGWLRTGDVGHMDEQGFVFIADRKKDVIVVSGFKVFPNEVEDIVAAHPGVAEVAAVGVEDEHSGEVVKLFVVKKDAALTEKALIAYCRERLTGYKMPRYVEFRDELPKSHVGKVLRRALQEQAAAATPC